MKSGYVALIGEPNVGKSTLLNALIDLKIAPVTPKPQTSRQRLIGILNRPDCQMLFVDTPGLLKPRYLLQALMKKEIESALADADVVVLVTSPAGNLGLNEFGVKLDLSRTVVALNKTDTIDRNRQEEIIRALGELGFAQVVAISALRREGLAALLEAVKDKLPEGGPYYPVDQLTTQSEKFFVAELIREAVFLSYGAEIPYSAIVEIDEFREQPGRKDLIRATIHLERQSQKVIVIGRKGAALKRLGIRAREKIEAFLERPVYLELRVKVKENWRRNESFIRQQFRQQ